MKEVKTERSGEENSVYGKSPLMVVEDIPVFARSDDYVRNYNEIAHDHLDATRQGDGNPNIAEGLWLQLEESTRKLVNKYSRPGTRILDAGVGMGRVLGPLDELHRYGVDISLDYLRIARQQGFDVALARLEDLPYRNEFFDVVIACDVLEHVIDLHACSTELVRVLKKGGTLIVRTPYLDDLDAYVSQELPYEFIHVRSFDLPGMRLLFGKILRMEFLEHSFVAPYLKGHPRMKLKLLKATDAVRKIALERNDSRLDVLRRAVEVSAEEYMNWFYALSSEHPELFGEIAEDLLEPLEMNVVFRKR